MGGHSDPVLEGIQVSSIGSLLDSRGEVSLAIFHIIVVVIINLAKSYATEHKYIHVCVYIAIQCLFF